MNHNFLDVLAVSLELAGWLIFTIGLFVFLYLLGQDQHRRY